MPEESVAEPTEPVDEETKDGASRHRNRPISCSVRGATEDVDVDTPDNGESKASSRARSRAISSSVKYTAEVGGVMARGEKQPPPPVEAAKYGGVACPVSSAKTGGEDEAVCRQAPSAKGRRVDEEQSMES